MNNPIKKAHTNHPIISLSSERWSPRAFSSKAIESQKLASVFEAARWAPSAFNEQPWRFIVGKKNDEVYQNIFESLVAFNKKWAGFAPVLFVAYTKKTFAHNNSENSTAAYDLGQAVAHLTYQAMAEGLFVHQMGGFDKEKIKESFNIDDNYEIHTVIALGYPETPDILPDDLKKAELTPRERNEIAFFVKGSL